VEAAEKVNGLFARKMRECSAEKYTKLSWVLWKTT